ncbi:CWF19 1, partial [Paramuricea clavata]
KANKVLKLNLQQNSGQNFFFDLDSKSGGQKRKNDDGNQRQPTKRKGPPPIQGPCWFCLGGSQVEKHLVVSVADHVYLAMAKGGLTPDHTLICPIAHYPSTVELPDPSVITHSA